MKSPRRREYPIKPESGTSSKITHFISAFIDGFEAHIFDEHVLTFTYQVMFNKEYMRYLTYLSLTSSIYNTAIN